ncbi:MAG TPA: NAD(P)-dependent oxidoreductase [Polyangiaceae bacterium]|nr:NAD(P)-dependent oxidoreductase [Polyangiaceae bacterium]
MTKKVLLATEKPFAPAARDKVVAVLKEARYEVVLLESYTDKAQLLDAVKDVDAMIIRSDKVDPAVLDAAKNLKLVVRAGAGYDNIDCAYAKQKGVFAMNTPGQNSNAVAELVFGMMLMMARGRFSGKSGTELKGKTIGIHAVGNVGRCVARIAKGFDMTVLGYHPRRTAEVIRAAGAEPVDSAETLYAKSEYISLHVPATPENKQSIGKALLMSMPKNACVINTARKEVIHEPELLEVFEARPDFRYATDVEPPRRWQKFFKKNTLIVSS